MQLILAFKSGLKIERPKEPQLYEVNFESVWDERSWGSEAFACKFWASGVSNS